MCGTWVFEFDFLILGYLRFFCKSSFWLYKNFSSFYQFFFLILLASMNIFQKKNQTNRYLSLSPRISWPFFHIRKKLREKKSRARVSVRTKRIRVPCVTHDKWPLQLPMNSNSRSDDDPIGLLCPTRDCCFFFSSLVLMHTPLIQVPCN